MTWRNVIPDSRNTLTFGWPGESVAGQDPKENRMSARTPLMLVAFGIAWLASSLPFLIGSPVSESQQREKTQVMHRLHQP